LTGQLTIDVLGGDNILVGRTSTAKKRLLGAAMELIYARGYSAVGVQEICDRAGVNKGSFYHFFPSKQALALAVIEAYTQQMQRGWEEVMSRSLSLSRRMYHLFEAAYKAQCVCTEEGGQMLGCPLGNLALELSTHDPSLRQKLNEAFSTWTQMIEHALREATDRGSLPPLDVSTTAQEVIAYFQGVLLLAKTRNDPTLVKELAQGAVHLVEAAAQAYYAPPSEAGIPQPSPML
jgi:TetR/AcrR family transcriptional repressor of nem operon